MGPCTNQGVTKSDELQSMKIGFLSANFLWLYCLQKSSFRGFQHIKG